ncbi:MAG: hypothetical protein RL226_1292, partial [Bacteroidota bacterium]
VFLLFASALAAQTQNQPQQNRVVRNQRAPSLSFGVVVAEPQGQFDESFTGTPVGLGGQFLTNLRRSPFELGVGFHWLSQGQQSKDIYIFQGVDALGDEVYDKGTMSVRNNIYAYNTMMRFKPFAGRVQPYGELIGGIQNFSTSTIIKGDGSSSEEVRDRAFRDFTLTYGWAAGLKVHVLPNLTVEGRFSNMRGGNIEFIDPTSIEINDTGDLNYTRITSNTDMWLFQAGIGFEF